MRTFPGRRVFVGHCVRQPRKGLASGHGGGSLEAGILHIILDFSTPLFRGQERCHIGQNAFQTVSLKFVQAEASHATEILERYLEHGAQTGAGGAGLRHHAVICLHGLRKGWCLKELCN